MDFFGGPLCTHSLFFAFYGRVSFALSNSWLHALQRVGPPHLRRVFQAFVAAEVWAAVCYGPHQYCAWTPEPVTPVVSAASCCC